MRTTTSLMAMTAMLCWSVGAVAQNGRPPMGGSKWTPAPGSPIGKPVGESDANKALDAQMQGKIAYTFAKWQNGQPPVVLPSPKTHLCMLTLVSGKFAGAGERVALYIDTGAPGGPRWILNGTSGQTQLRAEATCVEWTAFAISPVFNKSQFSAAVYDKVGSTGCKPNIQGVKAGKNATLFLSGLSGRFSGLGEGAKVGTGFMGVYTIEVKACSTGIDATPMGVSGPTPIKYRTLSARTPKLEEATMGFRMDGMKSDSWTSFFTPWDAGGPDLRNTDGSVWLVPADEAVCGLVEVSGKLQGYGEAVGLYVDKREDGRRWWRLRVGTQAEDTSIFGAARCLARDQR